MPSPRNTEPESRSLSGTANLTACIILLMLSTAARCQDGLQIEPSPQISIPYNLEEPSFRQKLPKKLNEISGLTTLDSSTVAAVQDEDGLVFILDARTGNVRSTVRFGRGGDYEGIEQAGTSLFILRSDGTLFELRDWRSGDVEKVIKHDTWLSKRYDAEGLARSPDGSSLLVACKGYPGRGLKGKRAVYRFALASRRLEERPSLIIDADRIERGMREGTVSRAVRGWLDLRRFKPSGIATHPVTGDIYVISSVSHTLAAFDSTGLIRATAKLDKKRLPQPEGIAFLPDGDLLISTESAGGRARLARFRYRPEEALVPQR